MSTELRTFWASRDLSLMNSHQSTLAQVAGLLDEGWELVQWQPVVFPPPARDTYLVPGLSTGYDVFLLRRVLP